MYSNYAALRDEKGVSDYKVSKDTGVPASTLSDWKNGLYKPKVDKLIKLAEYFGVSVEYFLKEGDHE
jgi:repressor LexA